MIVKAKDIIQYLKDTDKDLYFEQDRLKNNRHSMSQTEAYLLLQDIEPQRQLINDILQYIWNKESEE